MSISRVTSKSIQINFFRFDEFLKVFFCKNKKGHSRHFSRFFRETIGENGLKFVPNDENSLSDPLIKTCEKYWALLEQ